MGILGKPKELIIEKQNIGRQPEKIQTTLIEKGVPPHKELLSPHLLNTLHRHTVYLRATNFDKIDNNSHAKNCHWVNRIFK